MTHPARRLYELVEPIHLVTYMSHEPTQALRELGHEDYWAGYFAGRAAPLGQAPAEVVDAVFYNFAPGEVARHIPAVWRTSSPDEALAARERGSVAALRRILGDLADSPSLVRTADVAMRVATNAPSAGRPLYAGLRALVTPDEPLARLWHAATLLREHRGDGHTVALVAAQIDGGEAHALHAISQGTPAERFGRLSHLPDATTAGILDGLRRRGLVDGDGQLTEAGAATKQQIEDATDQLAAGPVERSDPADLELLLDRLPPITTRLQAAGSR